MCSAVAIRTRCVSLTVHVRRFVLCASSFVFFVFLARRTIYRCSALFAVYSRSRSPRSIPRSHLASLRCRCVRLHEPPLDSSSRFVLFQICRARSSHLRPSFPAQVSVLVSVCTPAHVLYTATFVQFLYLSISIKVYLAAIARAHESAKFYDAISEFRRVSREKTSRRPSTPRSTVRARALIVVSPRSTGSARVRA